jgi:hypothetical protein
MLANTARDLGAGTVPLRRFRRPGARPMAIGTVVLEDGSSVPGFLCEPVAFVDAPDISIYGGWRHFLESAAPST